MKVIVCGAGQVGGGIARRLAAEGNDVTVIDVAADLVRHLSETADVRGVVGHGSHPDVLEKGGAANADLLIAVTHADEVNMIACEVARALFNVPLRIARVRAQSYLNPAWQDLFSGKNLPIDVIISPEIEVGRSIMRRLDVPAAFDVLSFADGKVRVVGVRIDETCPVINTPLRQLTELFPDLSTVVAGISRGERTFVPKGNDHLLPGDDIYFVCDARHVERTLDIFGMQAHGARRVIIVGGGNIGLYLAQEMEARNAALKVKLIEHNKPRAEKVADLLNRTVVLHGDGLDEDLLREANVAEAETVVAVTNDDEVNILASVIAKKAGARRTLALINNPTYAPLVRSLGVDAFIDPRAATVSTILQHVRRGRIRRLYSVFDGKAEVIEAEALETSPLIEKPLREARIPGGIVIAAIIRGDKVHKPHGSFVMEEGDRVVLFASANMVRKVEQMFRVSLEYF